MNLMELFVKVGVDDQASGKIGGISDKLKNGLATAGKVAAAGVAAVTAATVAAGTAMAKGISKTAQYGDNIDKMSQKMGISAKAFQEWDFIMQHNGASIDSLRPAMKTLATAAETNNEAFEKLGMTQEQIASMSQEELFGATIKSLQQVEDTTERTYLAGQLLGRGATELGALLNMSAEETEAMRLQVHELGGVMSNDAVKAAAAYQDSLQNMKTAFSGISRGMLSEFLPSVTTIMDGLTAVFGGNDSGIGKIAQGVENFVDKLSKAMPKVLEAGGKIVNSIVTAISDNLPILLEAGLNVVMNILQGITDNLPKIVEALLGALPLLVQAGLDLIIALATGIADNLDTLIPAVVDAVMTIVDTLTNSDTLSKLLEAGLQIIISLVDGIVNNIDKIINGILLAVDNIINTLLNPDTLMRLIDAGIELLLALVRGIVDAIPQLISEVPKIISAIVTVIIAELPTIIAAAIDIVFALIDGLIGAIPELVAAIPNLIIGIVNGIVDNLDKIILAGPQIILALIKGLIGAIPELVASLPRIIMSIVNTFKEYDWGKIGKNIVQGLKKGISDMWEGLKKWFNDKLNSLVGGVKKLLGIHSPSTVFAGIGKNMALGVGEGWDKTFGDIQDEINKSMDFDDVEFGIATARSSVGGGSSSSAGGVPSKTEVVISVDESQSLMGFARVLLPMLKVVEREVYA